MLKKVLIESVSTVVGKSESVKNHYCVTKRPTNGRESVTGAIPFLGIWPGRGL